MTVVFMKKDTPKTKTALKKFTKLVELKKRALDLYVYSWRKFLNSKDIKDKVTIP